MGLLADILKGVTKPGRDIAELGRLVNQVRMADPEINRELKTLEDRQRAMSSLQEYQPLYQSQEEQLGTFLRPVETTLRNAATVGALAAPVGVVGKIGSRAAAGALGGGLSSYGMTPITEDTDLLKVLGGAAVGGTVGAAIGGLEKGLMSKAKKAAPSKVSEFGVETRGKAIGLDSNKLASKRGTNVSSTTQGKKVIKSYFDTMDELGLPTNTSELASQSSDEALKILNDQFGGALTGADDAVRFTSKDTAKLVSKIESAFKNNPKIKSNAQYQELVGDLLSLGDNYSPSQLNMVREKARELINWSTTSKAAVSQRATNQIFSVIDDFFKSKIGGTSEVLSKMKDIYTVRPIFQSKAPLAGSIKVGTASTNIAVPSGALQERIPEAVGKTLQKGIKMPQVSPEVLSKLGTAGIYGTRLGQAIGYEEPDMEQQAIDSIIPQESYQQPQESEDIRSLKFLLANEIMSGNISSTDAEAVLSLIGGGMGVTEEASAGEADAQNAVDMVSRLSQRLSESQLTGPIKGIGSINPYATEQKDLQSEIDLARQVIGKFLEGGVLRKEDEEKYKKILPTMFDTQEVAQRKLENLFIELQNRMSQYQTTGYEGYGQGVDEGALIDMLGL